MGRQQNMGAGHRSTLAFLRFCVIAANGIRKHTHVELLWITRRIRRISAFPSIVQQPSRHFYLNLAKIPPNQVIADFGRGSSVESESE